MIALIGPSRQAYPLDLLRTRLAAQTDGSRYYKGIGHAARRIAAEEGILGLYRGLGATLVQVWRTAGGLWSEMKVGTASLNSCTTCRSHVIHTLFTLNNHLGSCCPKSYEGRPKVTWKGLGK